MFIDVALYSHEFLLKVGTACESGWFVVVDNGGWACDGSDLT